MSELKKFPKNAPEFRVSRRGAPLVFGAVLLAACGQPQQPDSTLGSEDDLALAPTFYNLAHNPSRQKIPPLPVFDEPIAEGYTYSFQEKEVQYEDFQAFYTVLVKNIKTSHDPFFWQSLSDLADAPQENLQDFFRMSYEEEVVYDHSSEEEKEKRRGELLFTEYHVRPPQLPPRPTMDIDAEVGRDLVTGKVMEENIDFHIDKDGFISPEPNENLRISVNGLIAVTKKMFVLDGSVEWWAFESDRNFFGAATKYYDPEVAWWKNFPERTAYETIARPVKPSKNKDSREDDYIIAKMETETFTKEILVRQNGWVRISTKYK